MALRSCTRSEFEEMLSQDDACYVYYLDDDLFMRFLADSPLKGDNAVFSTNFADALLCPMSVARMLKILCECLFENRSYHIAKIRTQVEWL